jgi:methyl-accepting chemotaxis protein
VNAETRAHLDQALGTFRDDVSREFGTLRQEFGTLRGEFGTLRQEIQDTSADTRRHFDVVAEFLRHDIRGIAEGVMSLSERVDRLGTGLRTEMDERFAATHAVVRVAFQEVRRDIEDLRTSM